MNFYETETDPLLYRKIKTTLYKYVSIKNGVFVLIINLNTSPLSNIHVQIFLSLSVTCLFAFLVTSSKSNHSLTLMKSNYILFICYLFSWYSTKALPTLRLQNFILYFSLEVLTCTQISMIHLKLSKI